MVRYTENKLTSWFQNSKNILNNLIKINNMFQNRIADHTIEGIAWKWHTIAQTINHQFIASLFLGQFNWTFPGVNAYINFIIKSYNFV